MTVARSADTHHWMLSNMKIMNGTANSRSLRIEKMAILRDEFTFQVYVVGDGEVRLMPCTPTCCWPRIRP
jgi:hypothetical protein